MIIIKGYYEIQCVTDLVPPPLTSKVIKYIIEGHTDGIIKELTSQTRPFKPIQISPLFLKGRPLYSTGSPLPTIPKGSILNCWIALAHSDVDPHMLDISDIYGTPYGVVNIKLTEIEVTNVTEDTLGIRDMFKIEFITPTVLTAKYMIPLPLKVKSHKLPEKHKLLPQPSFIFSYLLRFWNSIAEPEEKIPGPAASDWEAYKLGRLADVTLIEIDYRLRPETVVIGRDSKGRLRRVRGFTGWVIYECLSKKLLPIYRKLLGLANYLGIGRSRGIGLGLVRVRAIT